MPTTKPSKRLAQWRSSRGMTQRELARLVGVQPRTIQHWEAGTSRPGDAHRLLIDAVTQGAVPAADWMHQT